MTARKGVSGPVNERGVLWKGAAKHVPGERGYRGRKGPLRRWG